MHNNMTITYLQIQPVESRQISETGLQHQQLAARLGGAHLLVLQHQFGPTGWLVGGEEALKCEMPQTDLTQSALHQ